MSEKTNILYLCVLIAISDYELQNEETHKIIKISKELKIDFNVHNAFEEIKTNFVRILMLLATFISTISLHQNIDN